MLVKNTLAEIARNWKKNGKVGGAQKESGQPC